MTGVYYFLAAAVVFWLGLWVAADDPVPKPNKSSRQTEMFSPFEFIEPERQVSGTPHELSSVQKVSGSWRQRVQSRKL
jgi:hypothetical protein